MKSSKNYTQLAQLMVRHCRDNVKVEAIEAYYEQLADWLEATGVETGDEALVLDVGDNYIFGGDGWTVEEQSSIGRIVEIEVDRDFDLLNGGFLFNYNDGGVDCPPSGRLRTGVKIKGTSSFGIEFYGVVPLKDPDRKNNERENNR